MRSINKFLGLDQPVDTRKRETLGLIGKTIGTIAFSQLARIQDVLADQSCPKHAPAPSKISEREADMLIIILESLVYSGDPYGNGNSTFTKDAKVKFPDGKLIPASRALKIFTQNPKKYILRKAQGSIITKFAYWFKNEANNLCTPYYLVSYFEVEECPKDHWKTMIHFDPDL